MREGFGRKRVWFGAVGITALFLVVLLLSVKITDGKQEI